MPLVATVRLDSPDPAVVLEALDDLVVRMFAHISEGLAAATEAFLDGDRAVARGIVAGDRAVDELQLRVEEVVERRLLAGGVADAKEVRLLISLLRIAPE